MNRIGFLQLDYHGQPFLTLFLPGEGPAWPIEQIGRALGVGTRGKGLLSLIQHEWSKDFVAHDDYRVLWGAEVEAIRVTQDPQIPIVSERATRLPLLLARGLAKVLERCDPIKARLLRAFLDEHLEQVAGWPPSPVLPVRSALSEAVKKITALSARANKNRAKERETRRALAEETRQGELDLEDRRFRARAIQRVIDVLDGHGWLDAETRMALEVEACAVATDDRIVLLGARDPRRDFDDDDEDLDLLDRGSRERQQLDAMLHDGNSPLVLAWEPDGRMGAFRYFPELRAPRCSPLTGSQEPA